MARDRRDQNSMTFKDEILQSSPYNLYAVAENTQTFCDFFNRNDTVSAGLCDFDIANSWSVPCIFVASVTAAIPQQTAMILKKCRMRLVEKPGEKPATILSSMMDSLLKQLG